MLTKLSLDRPAHREVDGDADNHNEQAGPGGGGAVGEEAVEHSRTTDDVDQRHNREAPGFVGTVGVRARDAQAQDSGDGQDVEDQGGGDDVIEEVAV